MKARGDAGHPVSGAKNRTVDAWHRSPMLREGGRGREEAKLTNYPQWSILLDLTSLWTTWDLLQTQKEASNGHA